MPISSRVTSKPYLTSLVYDTHAAPRYKSFQCSQHNQVFKLNLYERGNTGSHRWRANIAKPLRQLEHAFKHRASSGSGSTGSGSSLRSGLGSVGSGSGYRSSPVYGYGSGMGYGSGWGSSLGAGCGPNWGTGVSDDKNRASSTIVETGSNGDGDSDGDDSEVVSQSSDGENEGDEDGSEDLVVAFSPTSPAEVAKHSSEEQEVVTSSPPETQVTSEDNIVDQSYLEVENYGFYESGGSADDYGSYDCDGLDQDMTFDQNYRDCDDDAY